MSKIIASPPTRKNSKRNSPQRHYFLLVEVLVALALTAFVMVPLLRPYLNYARLQEQSVLEVYFQRDAENAFADVYAQVYQGDIPPSHFLQKETSSPEPLLIPLLHVAGEADTYWRHTALSYSKKHLFRQGDQVHFVGEITFTYTAPHSDEPLFSRTFSIYLEPAKRGKS